MPRGRGGRTGGSRRSSGEEKPSKICPICGRIFHWRKKWERDWESVRFCSERCRKRKLNRDDEALEQAILKLLTERAPGDTICPSEATRVVGGEDWRRLNDATRDAARRLAHQEKIEILQGGQPVDPSAARGAIRLARKR